MVMDRLGLSTPAPLAPGESTHAAKSAPPASATLLAAGAHARMQDAIGATHFKESLKHEAPKDALRDIGAPRALGLGLGGAAAGQDLTASKDGSAGVDEAQGGGQSSSNAKGPSLSRHAEVPPHHQTPPSVHSGASSKILRPEEGGRIRGEGRIRQ